MSANNFVSTNINGQLNVKNYAGGVLYPAAAGNANIQGSLTANSIVSSAIRGADATTPITIYTTPSGGITLGESSTALTISSPTTMNTGITTGTINSLAVGDPNSSDQITLNGFVKAENFQSTSGFFIGDTLFGCELTIGARGGSPENYRIVYGVSQGYHDFLGPVVMDDVLKTSRIDAKDTTTAISLFSNATTSINLGNANCPLTIDSPVTFTSTSNQGSGTPNLLCSSIQPINTTTAISLFTNPGGTLSIGNSNSSCTINSNTLTVDNLTVNGSFSYNTDSFSTSKSPTYMTQSIPYNGIKFNKQLVLGFPEFINTILPGTSYLLTFGVTIPSQTLYPTAYDYCVRCGLTNVKTGDYMYYPTSAPIPIQTTYCPVAIQRSPIYIQFSYIVDTAVWNIAYFYIYFDNLANSALLSSSLGINPNISITVNRTAIRLS